MPIALVDDDSARAPHQPCAGSTMVWLTEEERDFALILEFDPDASLAPGRLHAVSPSGLQVYVSCDRFSRSTWLHLARAAAPRDANLEDGESLAIFLRQRIQMTGRPVAPANRTGGEGEGQG